MREPSFDLKGLRDLDEGQAAELLQMQTELGVSLQDFVMTYVMPRVGTKDGHWGDSLHAALKIKAEVDRMVRDGELGTVELPCGKRGYVVLTPTEGERAH